MSSTIIERGPHVWQGLGANIISADATRLSNALNQVNFRWGRLHIEAPDPGASAIAFSDAQWDAYWKDPITACRSTYLTLVSKRMSILYALSRPPLSFLDSTRALRGDALVAFARMSVSAVMTIHKRNMKVEWVQICHAPSDLRGNAYMTTNNMMILVQAFRTILLSRSESLKVKLIGPGLQHLLSQNQASEPYITAKVPWDAWTIDILEPVTDERFYNAGNFEARKYVQRRLEQTLRFMNRARPGIPKFITAVSTNATRFQIGIDYGPSASEITEYAFRILDTLCHLVNAGCVTSFPWFIPGRKHDNRSAYRANGSKRPFYEILSLFSHCVPVESAVFSVQKALTDVQDETIKLIACKDNTFGIVLSRAQADDATAGALRLEIKNDDWKSDKATTVTMTFSLFPESVSADMIQHTVEVVNGLLTLSMKRIPYNCAIFIKGDIYKI